MARSLGRYERIGFGYDLFFGVGQKCLTEERLLEIGYMAERDIDGVKAVIWGQEAVRREVSRLNKMCNSVDSNIIFLENYRKNK